MATHQYPISLPGGTPLRVDTSQSLTAVERNNALGNLIPGTTYSGSTISLINKSITLGAGSDISREQIKVADLSNPQGVYSLLSYLGLTISEANNGAVQISCSIGGFVYSSDTKSISATVGGISLWNSTENKSLSLTGDELVLGDGDLMVRWARIGIEGMQIFNTTTGAEVHTLKEDKMAFFGATGVTTPALASSITTLDQLKTYLVGIGILK